MDRPSWAPLILSGALPRELSDFISIAILDLVTVALAVPPQMPLSGFNISWILLLLVPLVSALAALSNSSRRETEELALVAYGGSARQIELRYALRGCVITTAGLTPLLLRFLTGSPVSLPSLFLFAVLILLGGSTYAVPARRRTRSLSFVEHYKG